MRLCGDLMLGAVVDRFSQRWVGAGTTIDPAVSAASVGWGTVPAEGRAVVTAIVYVLTSGCA